MGTERSTASCGAEAQTGQAETEQRQAGRLRNCFRRRRIGIEVTWLMVRSVAAVRENARTPNRPGALYCATLTGQSAYVAYLHD